MTDLPWEETGDSALERLAAEPARPLAPLLQYAEAMTPLVVVLAFVPALYAVSHGTLTEDAAQQGLLSLRCLNARSVNEFVDPSAADGGRSAVHQPLLINWLTALSMWAFGPQTAAGLVGGAYLCTAGLVIAAYLAARRFGGAGLGLLTALLTAFSPSVMRLAQEPTPEAASALFAVLTIAGMVAHWQKSPAPASTQLLLGGLALALCLLAGGPVAAVVVLMLLAYAALWKLDVWRGSEGNGQPDRHPVSRRRAIRGVLILAVTGFAFGGWRALLMGSRYGAEFWDGWSGWRQSTVASGPWERNTASFLTQVLERVHPLGALAIAGVVLVAGEVVRRSESPGRRHRGLLLVWIATAGFLWWAAAAFGGQRGAVEPWQTLLDVPVLITAAIGLLGILERRIPFPWAVLIGLATLVEIVVVHEARQSGLSVTSGLKALPPGAQRMIWVSAVLLASAALLVAVWGALSESRQRRVLSLMVIGLLLAHCVWGTLEMRREAPGDRDLASIRGVLARYEHVAQWALVHRAAKDETDAAPPAQLVFTIQSLWPAARLLPQDSWESLAEQFAIPAAGGDGRLMVITCFPRNRAKPPAPPGLARQTGPGIGYDDHDVAAFSRASLTF
ncbi:MAG: glycosyltransferase family 39 protein [Planctomycetaceae bacterium]